MPIGQFLHLTIEFLHPFQRSPFTPRFSRVKKRMDILISNGCDGARLRGGYAREIAPTYSDGV